jgi:hypothetical protein
MPSSVSSCAMDGRRQRGQPRAKGLPRTEAASWLAQGPRGGVGIRGAGCTASLGGAVRPVLCVHMASAREAAGAGHPTAL